MMQKGRRDVKSFTKRRAYCPGCGTKGTKGYWEMRFDDDDKQVWECNNCHHRVPCRFIKPSGVETKSQKRMVEALKEDFGGTMTKHVFHNRSLWVAFENKERTYYQGDSISGTIGPRGKFKLTLYGGLGIIEIQTMNEYGVYVQVRR